MNKEERLLKLKNDLNFGIETKDGTFYVPKDDALTIAFDLLDEFYQPQFTILKSVADLLDERWKAQNRYLQRKVTVPRDALYNAVNPYDNELAGTSMGEWIDKNQNICFVYLAGKALGVDLVKVVEG